LEHITEQKSKSKKNTRALCIAKSVFLANILRLLCRYTSEEMIDIP